MNVNSGQAIVAFIFIGFFTFLLIIVGILWILDTLENKKINKLKTELKKKNKIWENSFKIDMKKKNKKTNKKHPKKKKTQK